MTGKRSSVSPGVRQAGIAEYISERGRASVDELAEKFDTSVETIRRDLNILADAERVRKIHGGARAVQIVVEGSFEERMNRHAAEKRAIADKLRKIITPHQTIFIDTGSTTLACAEILAEINGLTVITNSIRIADRLSQGKGKSNVLILGGQFALDNYQTVGTMTVSEIEKYQADRVILTVGALTEKGAMDFSMDEAQVARAMIASSDDVIIVADQSKLKQRAPFRVCALNQITTLVTSGTVPEEFAEKALAAGIEVL